MRGDGKRRLWNPWHGCHKCSPGCQNCYVYYLDGKRDRDAGVVCRSKTAFDLPRKKDRLGEYKIPAGSELGTCFTSDFFIREADAWREEAWEMIRCRPDVRFLIPTKRIERFDVCLPADWGSGYSNVAIAVSCETQAMADQRIPRLLELPVRQKYIFAAPLLEDIDFAPFLATGGIDRISVGGESYENARTCNFDWVRHIKHTCDRYHVAFDFHQTGSNFVMDGKRYRIPHHAEYSQAQKGMAYLRKEAQNGCTN